MSMECEFCKKVFLTKNSLIHHKKTAKYCLEIQGNVMEDYKCLYCKKVLSTNERLITHTAVCKERKVMENNEKEEKIKKDLNDQKKYFEDKIKEIDSRYQQQIKEKDIYLSSFEEKLRDSKETIQKLEARLEKFEDNVLYKSEKKPISNTTNNTTNNIVINNYLNLNDITKMSAFLEEKLDKDVVAGGQKSLAFLLSNTVLKDKYKCVDPSRQNFEFTNELGEIERDVKAKKLTNALIKSDICSRSGDKGLELWKKEDGSTDSLRYEAHSKNVMEMINFTIDNSTFRSELSALTS